MHKKISGLLDQIRVLAAQDNLACVIVHLNDTYLIDERRVNDKISIPGMARVAQLVNYFRGITINLLREDRVNVMHSGDFLSPSLIGKTTKGEHMCDILEMIGLTHFTLGNHEFDYEKSNAKTLAKQLKKKKWKPVICNLTHKSISHLDYVMLPAYTNGAVAVTGIAGKDTIKEARKFGWSNIGRRDDRVDFNVLKKTLDTIRTDNPGVKDLIVLSHMLQKEDRRTLNALNRFWKSGQCFVLGGHDHDIDWAERSQGDPILLKNLSNAKSLTVIVMAWTDIYRKNLEWYAREEDEQLLAPLNRNIQEWVHALGKQKLQDYLFNNNVENLIFSLTLEELATLRELGKVAYAVTGYVANNGPQGPKIPIKDLTDELRHVVEATAEEKDEPEESFLVLDGTDANTRSRSTDLGNYVADCICKKWDADLVILHAGSFRVDDYVSPAIDTHSIQDIFLYDNDDALLVTSMHPDEAKVCLDHGVNMPGGGFPQISTGHRVSVSQIGGKVTISTEESSLNVVIAYYLLDPEKSGDGYKEKLEKHSYSPKEIVQRKTDMSSILECVKASGKEIQYDNSIRLRAVEEVEDAAADYAELYEILEELVEIQRQDHQPYPALLTPTEWAMRNCLKYDPNNPYQNASPQAKRLIKLYLETLNRFINDNTPGYAVDLLKKAKVDRRGFRSNAKGNLGKSSVDEYVNVIIESIESTGKADLHRPEL